MMIDTREKDRRKLKKLLRKLFQFNLSDLDFGIYRILNQKRDQVKRFIDRDLIEAIEQELEEFRGEERGELEQELEEKRKGLGGEAFDNNGNMRDEYRNLNLQIVKDYMEIREQLEQLEVAEETEAHILNDLYRFFSRYYDNGDFISKRRYSSQEAKYYVPYNGEEVLLHWANQDQYYVKTSEYFVDYAFQDEYENYKFYFRLLKANVPPDNVKGEKRYFVLSEDEPVIYEKSARTISINFEYRPITEGEEERFIAEYNEQQPKSRQRKTLDRSVICVALEKEILEQIEVPAIIGALSKLPKDKDTSLLQKHLNRYTARNTMDYFVHKDLGNFLQRELDFFLKNEVLKVDDFIGDVSGESFKHVLTRARVVRNIANKIIAFLDQIEGFQKRLFEKKKFVIQTDYCVTLDRVPNEFYPDILENKGQLEEWRKIYAIDKWENNLFWDGELDKTFLENHPYLMIDTAFFDGDFKERLLATFDELEEAIDGLLIHGENFQALNLLKTKYREQVKCIYIDPPYNTGNDRFIYKDNYQHSSWLSMLSERLKLAHRFLNSQGVLFVSIDDHEEWGLHKLLGDIFGPGNRLPNVVVRRRKSQPNLRKGMAPVHDFLKAACKDYLALPPLTYVPDEFGIGNFSNPDNDSRGPWVTGPCTNRGGSRYEIETPAGVVYEDEWRFTKDTYEKLLNEGRIYFPNNGEGKPRYKIYQNEKKEGGITPSTWWNDVGTTQDSHKLVENFFGFRCYDNPKPIELLERIVDMTTNTEDLILDFFAGSGTTAHAVLKLNQKDDGNRKYILVEMGEYFDTVLKPRIQKSVFSSKWKDGVPQDRNGQSHMFKYQRIESYEDALNNIKFNEPEEAQQRLLYEDFDDYMLHYMLDFETKDSPSLLSHDAFEKPFDYTLKIQHGHETPQDTVVDLVETFHYLIGMQVRKFERYEHQERKYVVSLGDVRTRNGVESVVVIWRNTEGLNLEKEAEWANEKILPERVGRVYTNGPSFIKKSQPLELTFRDKMEEGPNVS